MSLLKHKPVAVGLKGGRKFRRLLGKEAGGINLRSGFVVIRPGKSVGMHTTGQREEILIVLTGKARLYYGEKKNYIGVSENNFVYIPPETRHNVENTGSSLLKYVYITTR